MADTKISALTQVVTPSNSDELAVNQSFVSKKISLLQTKFDLARVVGSFSATGQTASSGPITLLASPPDGIYRVTIGMRWEVAGSGNATLTNVFYGISYPWEKYSLDQGVPSIDIPSNSGLVPATDGCAAHLYLFSGADAIFQAQYVPGTDTNPYSVAVTLERIPEI